MRAWLVRALFRRMFDGLRRGDVSLPLRLAAAEVRFVFPGDHPFQADYTTREEVADWLTRLAVYRPRLEIHDVAVTGPPWDTRAFVRYHDRIDEPPRGGPYHNDVCSFVRARWFRIREYVVYLDTQKVAAAFGDHVPPGR